MSTAQAQAVSQALSQADGVSTGGQTQQSQPVEFNHAINYVNKIKVRKERCEIYTYIYVYVRVLCINEKQGQTRNIYKIHQIYIIFRIGSKVNQTNTNGFWKYYIRIRKNSEI